ncbi:glutaredoxin family protein [Arthrobacter sp. MP_2.3]|uniref:glutaredoxin family protein n=1 Tax=Arthrobacter sp. MP_2.3 TaxID=3349633 RepID=UPI0038D4C434
MTSPTAGYTVYTKPACPNCDKTKAYFESKGITYTAVDITENPAALEYISVELGYAQAPVVVSNSDDQEHWSGLRRDKLVQASMNHRQAA